MRSLHSLHGWLLFINVFTWSHPLQWTLSSFIKWLYLANFSAWFIVEPQKCLWRLIIMHFSSLCRETGRASLKLDAPKQCEFLLFSNCLHLSWHLVCVSVAQLCLTLCESMACSLPDSSVHGVLQARILEWVAMPSSRNLLNPGIEPTSNALQADSLLSEPPEKPLVVSLKFLVSPTPGSLIAL